MNLGFQDRFVPLLEKGLKRHSIRGGNRWKVGMRADLFKAPRRAKVFDSKGDQIAGMRLLFRATVTRVQRIQFMVMPVEFGRDNLFHERVKVWIDGEELSSDEKERFAVADGFSSVVEMFDFWRRTHKLGTKCKIWIGQIVHWDYERRSLR